MHLCKSFRWGEERLHRSPKSLRWDEEPLYRSPRVRKFYTFLPAKHCKWGAGRKSKANVSGGTRNHCTAVPNVSGGTRNHCTAVPNVSGGTRNHCTAVPEIRSGPCGGRFLVMP